MIYTPLPLAQGVVVVVVGRLGSRASPTGPEEKEVCAWCGKKEGEEATSSGGLGVELHGARPRDLYVHSWGSSG